MTAQVIVSSLEVEVMIDAEAWQEALGDPGPMTDETLRAALTACGFNRAPPLEVSVTLTDDAAIRDLNQRFRDQDKATNVLSFPAFDGDALAELRQGRRPSGQPPGLPITIGDIILAFETVAAEATAQDKPLAAHVRHLLAHGFLHLLGYDHMEDAEAEAMERLEIAVMASLGLPDPYGMNDSRQARP